MKNRLFLFFVFSALVTGLMFSAGPHTAMAQEDAAEAPAEETVEQAVAEKTALAKFNDAAFTVLFKDVSGGAFTVPEVNREGEPVLDEESQPIIKNVELPFIVIFLLLGALFFSLYYRFINIRCFKHAVSVVRGHYDDPNDKGEISHFRALTSALSATVGLGNIAGVAVAIQLGGPGAVFWMWIAAVLGMSAKFSSCTLAQMYRQVNADGSISGGPMYYLDLGLGEKGGPWKPVGKILGVMFAVMVMGGAIGGGNMFQVNQTAEAMTDTFELNTQVEMTRAEYRQFLVTYPEAERVLDTIKTDIDGEININLKFLRDNQKAELGDGLAVLQNKAAGRANLGIGIIMAVFVGAVVLGGIKRIGAATSKIVPFMVGVYVLASLYVILTNLSQVGNCFSLIFNMAFKDNAFYGGVVGVLVWGIQRAAFSNEAGLGSAAIAHAAAKTHEPVREGLVAMLGPFIDTIIVCTMTALVVIITGAWADPTIPQKAGVSLTTAAFGSAISWFPFILTGCITLFAYSTMISWCYYGERGWIYLLNHFGGAGLKTIVIYRVLFVAAIILGAVNPLSDVLNFSDAMILSMAFPNIIGSIFLAPKVWELTKDYVRRLQSGDIKMLR